MVASPLYASLPALVVDLIFASPALRNGRIDHLAAFSNLGPPLDHYQTKSSRCCGRLLARPDFCLRCCNRNSGFFSPLLLPFATGASASGTANSPPGSNSARHPQSGSPVMHQYIHAATRHVPWNKGKLVGQKAPAEAEGYLGDSSPLADPKPNPRSCLVQSSDRQQTEIL